MASIRAAEQGDNDGQLTDEGRPRRAAEVSVITNRLNMPNV